MAEPQTKENAQKVVPLTFNDLMWTQQNDLRSEVRETRKELNARMDRLETRMDKIENRIAYSLARRQSRRIRDKFHWQKKYRPRFSIRKILS